jgi:membrane-bound lytic murein transglycosylase D
LKATPPTDFLAETRWVEAAMIDTALAHFKRNYVPQNHDADLISERLQCIENIIKMDYNVNTLSWIKVYTIRKRHKTEEILGRSKFYFPIFEELLKKHGMPDELKYLAVVESALEPRALSVAAAVGLWQFIPSTGTRYGLRQDWYVDERSDPFKATEAACRYLKYLYGLFGDWHLALAAYNCGEGRVAAAIKTSGKRNFWDLYPYLPLETRGYVPAFIAATYVMNYAAAHNLQAKNPITPIPSDTILVSQYFSLEVFAQHIQVPLEDLMRLNSHLKKNTVPEYLYRYPVRYPASKRDFVAQNRKYLLEVASKPPIRNLQYHAGYDDTPVTMQQTQRRSHVVQEYDSLPLIALRYNVTVANILAWNRLKPGQEPATGTVLHLWLNTDTEISK